MACELDDEVEDNDRDSEAVAFPFQTCAAAEDNHRVREEAVEDTALADNVRLLVPGALDMQVDEKAIQDVAPENLFHLVSHSAASAGARQRRLAYYH